MNLQRQTQYTSSVGQTTLMMLAMLAERYLTLEDASSHKMALEITAGWDCKSIV